jgi:hypothetical protein
MSLARWGRIWEERVTSDWRNGCESYPAIRFPFRGPVECRLTLSLQRSCAVVCPIDWGVLVRWPRLDSEVVGGTGEGEDALQKPINQRCHRRELRSVACGLKGVHQSRTSFLIATRPVSGTSLPEDSTPLHAYLEVQSQLIFDTKRFSGA